MVCIWTDSCALTNRIVYHLSVKSRHPHLIHLNTCKKCSESIVPLLWSTGKDVKWDIPFCLNSHTLFLYEQNGFLHEGRGWEREGKKHPCESEVQLSIRPDQELNLQPLVHGTMLQPTQPHQSGLFLCFCWFLFLFKITFRKAYKSCVMKI